MKLRNLTPHDLHIMDSENNVILTLKSEGIARCEVKRTTIDHVNGIPLNMTFFGEVQDLPEPETEVLNIVSAITAQAVRHRMDVVITDDAVRDDDGKIIGCRAFARLV